MTKHDLTRQIRPTARSCSEHELAHAKGGSTMQTIATSAAQGAAQGAAAGMSGNLTLEDLVDGYGD